MKLSNLFTNGAVLQRGMSVPVWGTTKPESIVKIRINEISACAASSADGDFLVRLPELPVGGPYRMTAENVTTGEKVEVNDILVGEVWLASGQSNMEFPLGQSPVQQKEFASLDADPSMLRMITVPRSASMTQEKDFCATWEKATKLNASSFSAVALWFGNKLREKLGVPIGIIHSSWGGTFAEAWTSRGTLMRNPDVRDSLLEMEKNLLSHELWQKKDITFPLTVAPNALFKKYAKADPGNEGFAKGWANPEFDDSDWKPLQIPGSWIVQKIAGNGGVWARMTVDIPERWSGKQLCVRFGGIDKQDVTYFNGVKIGKSGEGFDESYWCRSRCYPVPAELVRAGRAVIAVRAYSFFYDGSFNGIPENFVLHVEGDDTDIISLAGTWRACAEVDYGVLEAPVGSEVPQQGPGNPNTFSILFDGMIHPLIPYALRGAIWYQGETNAHNIPQSLSYARKMADMIADWRFHWGQGDFPFYMVQLANFRAPIEYDEYSTWAPLRESQRIACAKTPNSAMALAIDVGEAEDIHPKDKRSVGERLAALALHNTYFMDTVPCGPLPKEVRKENGALRILFEHADGGLVFKGNRSGFYLAGNAGEFKKADFVEVEGTSILVRSSEVAFPCRVRYNWSDNPVGTLYNGAGFPASGFDEK